MGKVGCNNGSLFVCSRLGYIKLEAFKRGPVWVVLYMKYQIRILSARHLFQLLVGIEPSGREVTCKLKVAALHSGEGGTPLVVHRVITARAGDHEGAGCVATCGAGGVVQTTFRFGSACPCAGREIGWARPHRPGLYGGPVDGRTAGHQEKGECRNKEKRHPNRREGVCMRPSQGRQRPLERLELIRRSAGYARCAWRVLSVLACKVGRLGRRGSAVWWWPWIVCVLAIHSGAPCVFWLGVWVPAQHRS
jgi:hypothetical protein